MKGVRGESQVNFIDFTRCLEVVEKTVLPKAQKLQHKFLSGLTEKGFYSETLTIQPGGKKIEKQAGGRPACLGQCQAMLGPVFSHWAPSPKIRAPL